MIVDVQRRGHVQRMTYDEFEQRIRDGELSENTLVRFDVVTGNSFKPLGELELYKTLADPVDMQFRRNLERSGVPIVTALIVGIQIRIYLSSWAPGAELWLQEGFTNWTPAVLELGQIYRLITYGLLHVDFTHLMFNLLFLAYTGYHLERSLGRSNLVLLYFGSVFTGGVLSMAMAPDRPSLGASGGDFGLLAAAVIFGWKHLEAIPARARKYFGWAMAPYLFVSILSGINAELVDNWGHLGGLLGGMTIMTFLGPEVLDQRAHRNRLVRAASVTILVAMAVALRVSGTRLVPLVPADEIGWQVERPSYWRKGWTFTGDRGWFSPTQQAALVITTTTHPRPLDGDDAVEQLVQRLSSGSSAADLLLDQPTRIDGREARRVTVSMVLDGEPQIVEALVIARGVYEHRVVFQASEATADRYAPLADRIMSGVSLDEPTEVSAARTKALTHPRSWEPAVELGDAAYRAGEPEDALRAYERALALAPGRSRALVGQLRVYADYGLPDGDRIARLAVQDAHDDPDVLVAAADALAASGHADEAITLLDDAWLRFPGDTALRRARLRWGLDVELPAAEGAEVGAP